MEAVIATGTRARRQRLLAALVSALLVAPAPARALTCRASAGPPGAETTAEFSVLSPADGAVLRRCNGTVEIAGTWSVSGPVTDYDVYLVIDMSSSTQEESGVDVDGDGRITRPADDVFRAELAAARAFVDALDPARSRVAVITFMDITVVWQELTADLDAARAALTELHRRGGTGDTLYVPAMQAVEDQVRDHGDPARRSQLVVFLSDGEPWELLSQTDAAAQELADLSVVMDTFGLGAHVEPEHLANMAAITDGTFVDLDLPGDIVEWLPEFVPSRPITFQALDPASGTMRDVTSGSDGTFHVTLDLLPGANVVTLSLRAGTLTRVEATCELHVTLEASVVADAGPDVSGCAGRTVVLDGSGTFTNCAASTYRWIDCAGADPCVGPGGVTCEVRGDGTCDTYTLEVRCSQDACEDEDEVRVAWVAPEPPAPRVAWSCGGMALLERTDAGTERGWDLDSGADTDGDGDPSNDRDASGDEVIVSAGGAPTRQLAAWSRDGACVDSTTLTVDFAAPVAATYQGWTCKGMARLWIDCPTGIACRWDLDATVDADGDGDPSDDADTPNEFAVLTADGRDEVALAALLTRDGCTSSTPVLASFLPSAPPRSLDTTVCPGDPVVLDCGLDPREAPLWDLDTTTDTDGDGDAGNDLDAEDCVISYAADADRTVRLWRETATGCEVAAEGLVHVGMGEAPAEVADLRITRQGITMVHEWAPLPGVGHYRVLRGMLASLWVARIYDHGADEASGGGACDVHGVTLSDDDLTAPGTFYYLVTALSACGGGEGPTGFGRTSRGPFARPPGQSLDCPPH